MLGKLALREVGPVRALDLDLAPRVNLLIGDNGLGKTFLLDVAWWALTRTWAGEPAYPYRPRGNGALPTQESTIDHTILRRQGADPEWALQGKASYSRQHQDWGGFQTETKGPASHGPSKEPFWPFTIVIYARVDGSFALWDSFRSPDTNTYPELGTVRLTPREVWSGKTEVREKEEITLCNGLIRDWLDWEARYPEVFARFVACLKRLSAGESEEMVPGKPTRVRLGEARDIPTLDLPYGNVPITLLSAGMRRVLSLAYLLVWSWEEHLRSAELVGQAPTRDLVLLLDEAESHLHPQWQRVILPALLEVVAMLSPELQVQLIVTTHSPLVPLSLEPYVHPEQDALWMLDLVDGQIQCTRDDWHRRGSASAWLTSDAFDLDEDRNVPAEQAILRARELMKSPQPSLEELKAVHQELRRILPDTDPFWVRWLYVAEQKGLAL